MATSSDQRDPGSADELFTMLTAGAADAAESRVLDALVGEWRVTTAWEQIAGAGVRHFDGRSVNGWIFGGRVLELRGFDVDGTENAKLLCAFDPTIGDYVAFGVNALSTCFVLERGQLDDGGRALVFDGVEPLPGGQPGVRFQRTFRFDGDDCHTTSITYPEVPPGTYGSMVATNERTG